MTKKNTVYKTCLLAKKTVVPHEALVKLSPIKYLEINCEFDNLTVLLKEVYTAFASNTVCAKFKNIDYMFLRT